MKPEIADPIPTNATVQKTSTTTVSRGWVEFVIASKIVVLATISDKARKAPSPAPLAKCRHTSESEAVLALAGINRKTVEMGTWSGQSWGGEAAQPGYHLANRMEAGP